MRLKLIRYIPPNEKTSIRDRRELIDFINKLGFTDPNLTCKIYASPSGIYMDSRVLIQIAEAIISMDLNEIFQAENYRALAILAGWLVEYLYDMLIKRIGPLNSARIIAKYTDTSLYLRPELIKEGYFDKFGSESHKFRDLLKENKRILRKIRKDRRALIMKYSFDPGSEKIGLLISLLQKVYESKDAIKPFKTDNKIQR